MGIKNACITTLTHTQVIVIQALMYCGAQRFELRTSCPPVMRYSRDPSISMNRAFNASYETFLKWSETFLLLKR